MARKGLPKKYAKMGFKKGWKAYKASKRKTGGGSTSKKKTTKKKSGSKKKKTYTKKKGSGKVSKKISQSDIMMGLATGGPAIQKGLQFMESGNSDRLINDVPAIYSGFNPGDNSFDASRLARGWGGTANEIMRRKIFRATGTTAMPSKGSLLEHGVYYAKAVFNALDNQGDMQAAHLQFHKDYFGVDLEASGMDAWQPGEMADTALPLFVTKHVKKAIRGAGYGKYIPKWM